MQKLLTRTFFESRKRRPLGLTIFVCSVLLPLFNFPKYFPQLSPYGYLISSDASDIQPVAVAARSKALVCGLSPAEIVGSNPTGCMDVSLL